MPRNPSAVIREVGKELASAPIDIAFLGIGENGHIAFNDPPANFTTEDPYIMVNLDEVLPPAAGGRRMVCRYFRRCRSAPSRCRRGRF